jgi:hypothetical protein
VRLFRALRQGLDEKTTNTVRALTGTEPRGFGEFAREHAALFGLAERALHAHPASAAAGSPAS